MSVLSSVDATSSVRFSRNDSIDLSTFFLFYSATSNHFDEREKRGMRLITIDGSVCIVENCIHRFQSSTIFRLTFASLSLIFLLGWDGYLILVGKKHSIYRCYTFVIIRGIIHKILSYSNRVVFYIFSFIAIENQIIVFRCVKFNDSRRLAQNQRAYD